MCAVWYETIRRKIGILFGASTAYPEYLTCCAKVKTRYDALQGKFAATHADTVASK